MKIKFIFLFSFFCGINLFAQKSSNVWYFGSHGGIDFNSGKPKAIHNSAMSAIEGCSSVCDVDGKLLFYTDGDTVWNKNHQVMETGLMGHWSATQGAMIIPLAEDKNKFYIFTVDAVDGQGRNGIRYSVVDMTGNNGLGEVKKKNEALFAPVSEKLTAAYHENGKDIWVIAHNATGNNFLSWLVSADGKIGKSVQSNTGFDLSGVTGAGQMKVSPDGKTLAMALYGSGQSALEVFKFNNSTGKISEGISLIMPDNGSYCYGAEFSSNSKKLYCCISYSKKIYQLDMSDWSSQKINSSVKEIGITSGIYAWGMQMGPDGKIYISHDSYPVGDSYLGVIENPDGDGKNCKYNDEGFNLGGKISSLGLPNVIPAKYVTVSNGQSDEGNGRDENGSCTR